MNLHPPIDDRTRPSEANRSEGFAVPQDNQSPDEDQYRSVRRLIWVYFWLLLLEGALRKWFLPSFANPLLVVRDPVAILIYLAAFSKGIFPSNGFVKWTIFLAILSAIASIFSEHGNMLVTLFGLRTDFLHLPLIFLIPKVFSLSDVEKVGKWLIITAIPMALLVVLQFRSSPYAWVNAGVGGTLGSQMEVGYGKIRPPGTFSFTNGLAVYLSVLAAFVMSWQLKRSSLVIRAAPAAIPATGLMVAISGSRTVLVSIVLIFLGVIYVCVRNREFFGRGVRAALMLGVAFFVLQLRGEVRQGISIHEGRVAGGGGVRMGLIDRTLSGFIEPFAAIRETPLLGRGIGLGTTAAGGLLYGQRTFILAETEWLRVVMESGPILGLAFLGLRVAMVVFIVLRARRALDDDNPLPLILFAAVFPVVLSGQFGVPTILGFATFGAGLCLAATNIPRASLAPELFQVSPNSVTNPKRTVRGRSIYAEKLHGR